MNVNPDELTEAEPEKETAADAPASSGDERYLPRMAQAFDAAYYSAQSENADGEIPEVDEDAGPNGDPLLAHYLRVGHETLASPHPLFDARYYVAAHPDVARAGVNPLLHYVRDGYKEERRFHPLFDVDEYRKRSATPPGTNLLLDYLGTPASRRAVPSTHLDLSEYAAETDLGDPEHADPFLHYLSNALGTADDPFPGLGAVAIAAREHPALIAIIEGLAVLFDLDYYRSQLEAYHPDELNEIGDDRAQLILHYMRRGVATRLNPNPLFDTTFYLENHPALRARGENPLYDFLAGSQYDAFHPLFDVDVFRAARSSEPDSGDDDPNPLLAYLELAETERPSPSPYFDPDFYREANDDLDLEDADPLFQYLTSGYREGRWPNPAFDPSCFARGMGRNPDAVPVRVPLSEFLEIPAPRRPEVLDLLDPAHYYGRYSDVADAKLHAGTHFMQFGLAENRSLNTLRSDHFLLERDPRHHFNAEKPIDHYLLQRARERGDRERGKRVLFVGHEASRTGAPAILLNIVKHFAAQLGRECITVLDTGGDLSFEYERFSHVLYKRVGRLEFFAGRADLAAFEPELRTVLERFADDPPEVAFCNSLEVAIYGESLKRLGMTVVSLVHEVADGYHPSALEALDRGSDVIVCPAEFVADRLRRAAPGCADRIVVEPQGLLRPNYGEVQWGTRERVFEEQRIAADDVVVLTCGTADGRKGIDIFTDVAGEVTERLADGPRVWFVWLGSGFEQFVSRGSWTAEEWDRVKYWAEWDMRRSGASDRICIVPPVADAEAYFAAADMLALTSRADPFPCVVHEAMACKLPVLAFADAGGAPEALGDTGVVLPYLDRKAMADAIVALAEDPARRKDLGERAEKRVREEYRFSDYANRLWDIGQRALGDAEDEKALEPEQRAEVISAAHPQVRRDVVLSTPAWSVSGVNTFATHLLEQLESAGHTPELVFPNGRWDLLFAEEPPPSSVPYRFLQPRVDSSRARWEMLENYLRENAPCVYMPNFDYRASAISPRLPSGVGILGIAHSDHVEHYEHVYRLGRYWNRIVAVSSRIRDRIVELNPAFESKLVEIPYGVPTPSEKDLRSKVEERADSLEPIRILYAGRLEQDQKRVLDYVEVVKRLSEAGVPFELTMAGDGSEMERLERELGAFIQAGAVKLVGRVKEDEVAELALDSHVFLLLSDYEGLPISVMEGMANGCVPVVSRIDSGIDQLVEQDRTGIVFEPRDFGSVVAILDRLREDPERWRGLSEAAAASLDPKGYTVDAMGARYAELVEEILDELKTRRYRRPTPLTTIDPDAIAPAALARTADRR